MRNQVAAVLAVNMDGQNPSPNQISALFRSPPIFLCALISSFIDQHIVGVDN
jgi:hypothetical protein